MFDAERLIGNMLMKKTRRKGGLGIGKGALGVGLLGVAIAAYEHYSEKQSQTPKSAPPSPPSSPPPLPANPNAKTASGLPPANNPAQSSMPPPMPTSSAAPPLATPSDKNRSNTLLLDAMIAAAACDGDIDADERASILNQARLSGADEEAIATIEAAMQTPKSLDDILAAATPDMAENLYVASLTAIEVDTDSERDYLDRLAEGLQIAPHKREQLDAALL